MVDHHVVRLWQQRRLTRHRSVLQKKTYIQFMLLDFELFVSYLVEYNLKKVGW